MMDLAIRRVDKPRRHQRLFRHLRNGSLWDVNLIRAAVCSYDDQKARLDNLAVELQSDPTTSTYVFAYGGRTSAVGQADRLLARVRDYLVIQRGIDSSRIILVNGGFREEDCVEVWIVPRGATPPQPSPTVQPSEVRPTKSTPRRRRG